MLIAYSKNKFIVLFIIIFGTLSFPIRCIPSWAPLLRFVHTRCRPECTLPAYSMYVSCDVLWRSATKTMHRSASCVHASLDIRFMFNYVLYNGITLIWSCSRCGANVHLAVFTCRTGLAFPSWIPGVSVSECRLVVSPHV